MHPSTSTQPVTLAEAFKNAGKQKVHATDPLTGESGEFYKMQDMSSAICNATNITGEASQMEAVDIRDNKLYWITKMADGKCWMTENLDLDLISDPQATGYVALTSENTNLTLYGSKGYDNTVVSDESNGYSCSNDSPTCEGGIITWLPERDTIPPSDLNSTTWKNDKNNPYSYDSGSSSSAHNSYGTYYNWTASIASNNSSSYTGGVAANSICPKGWRLPNTASMEGGYEFSKLLYAYNISKDNKNTDGYASNRYSEILSAPLYFIRSGRVASGSLYGINDTGFYVSNAILDSNRIYTIRFYSTANILNIKYSDSKEYGYTLRCLAE